MKLNVFALVLTLLIGLSWAAVSASEHYVIASGSFGGTDWDLFNSVAPTNDGGFLCVGSSQSDLWVVKCDQQLHKVWEKLIDMNGNDAGNVVIQDDDGYIIGGWSSDNAFMIRLDDNGNEIWRYRAGGGGYNVINSVAKNNNNYYAGGDWAGNPTVYKFYKLNSTIIWKATVSGGPGEVIGIYPTDDGGCLFVGYLDNGNYALLGKIDSGGNIIWKKTQPGSTVLYSIDKLLDGNYVIGGRVHINGPYLESYIMKMDESGNVIWEKTLIGLQTDCILDITSTSDGGFITAGYHDFPYYNGALGPQTEGNAWINKYGPDGLEEWDLSIGDVKADDARWIIEGDPNTYVFVGTTMLPDSSDGNGWVVKIGQLNQPPILTSIGDKTVDEGQTLTFTLTATDPDENALTFAAGNLPLGATFDESSGIFSWTPDYTQAGSYPDVHFEVTDGTATDFEDISISVENVNRLNSISPANIWIGLKNSDAVGLRVDLLTDVYLNSEKIASGQINNVSTGSSGFNNARLYSIPIALLNGPVAVQLGDTITINVSTRRTCYGGGHNSGTVRLWYNGQPIDTGQNRDAGTRFDIDIDGAMTTYYLRANFELSDQAGSSRIYIDKPVDSRISCANNRPFVSFGSWNFTIT